MSKPVRTAVLSAWVLVTAACGGKSDEPVAVDGAAGSATPANCPKTAPPPAELPRVTAAHRTLAYWIEHTQNADDVLLDPAAIADMNASLAVDRSGEWHGEYDLLAAVDSERLKADVAERVGGLHAKLTSHELVDRDGSAVPAGELSAFDPGQLASHLARVSPELRVALETIALHCGPRSSGFFTAVTGGAPNTRFDRNSCSSVHPQEVVQLLATWPNGMRLVRTRYASGWIAKDAKLSPPLPDALRDPFVRGARVQVDDTAARGVLGASTGPACPAGALLPLARDGAVHVATADGFREAAITTASATRRPLTRKSLLTQAFRYLDSPYGWGGSGGGHDCSSFLMDVFATFDIHLPRHSSWQARAGTFSIDVSKVTSDDERTRIFDAATAKGIVLLGFPGHIMLYLGRNERGVPMVIHSIAEYVVPCANNGETIVTNDKVAVTDLELGRGTSRRALIERITTVTVIGKPPGVELGGAAELRPAAPVARPDLKKCKDSDDVILFASPRVPNAKQPLRVIVTANRDPGADQLTLFDPGGDRVTLSNVVRLAGGPPWSVIATVDAPIEGTWTAVFGDGARIDACKVIAVAKSKPGANSAGKPDAPAWEVRRNWTRATEMLYATFVQRLFDYPPDQDLTWPNLHVLLRDPAHNILFNHLHQNEEERLLLKPDCADLPYLLRSYFSWKMGLPFAYHRCTRGTATRPPVCKHVRSNLMIRDWLDDKVPYPDDKAHSEEPPEELVDDATGTPLPIDIPETDGVEEAVVRDVDAFGLFWGRQVANAVHAASGRTVPDDDETDYYPVALTREWLRPGVAYHDPFGHVMVIAAWVPQSVTSYGMLLAADAQPDGTVGRKRFWRGNFLFTPESKVAGAGFKAFRPFYFKKKDEVTLLKNAELKRSRTFAPFSRQQYEGKADDFYDTVEALINPRPLDPFAALLAVVDSLHSQAKLRVVSVKNGEEWIAQHPGAVIAMPDGPDIFLTSGVWEDFATPSRDFRLLIAMDTVLDFPAAVKRAPERFALAAASADATVAKLEQELDKLLRARSIDYVRSDGKVQSVTLRELIDRRAGFEVSYNPNDCIEHRWAAIEGSPERASCQRRAPADQQAKLVKFRTWFAKRQRPVR